MNKPFQSGVGISSVLRSLAAFAVLFFAVGISQSYAQSSFTSASSLTDKQVVQAYAPAGTTFLSSTDAMLQLKTAIGALENTQPQSASDEVDAAAKVGYYTVVLNAIAGGAGVGDAFNNSSRDLSNILVRYDSSVAPSFGAVRQSTLSLVSQ